jgi:hypothetical protein
MTLEVPKATQDQTNELSKVLDPSAHAAIWFGSMYLYTSMPVVLDATLWELWGIHPGHVGECSRPDALGLALSLQPLASAAKT